MLSQTSLYENKTIPNVILNKCRRGTFLRRRLESEEKFYLNTQLGIYQW